MEIGHELKKLRLKKGLTIKDLADKTGLSTGFLSNTEHNINSPSISSLSKICKALDIPIAQLFGDEHPFNPVTRKNEREVLVDSRKPMALYELLSSYSKKLRPVLVTLGTNGSRGEGVQELPVDEIGYVIQGRLQISIGADAYVLEEGDSFYIKAFQPHRFKNVGDVICISIWVAQGTGD